MAADRWQFQVSGTESKASTRRRAGVFDGTAVLTERTQGRSGQRERWRCRDAAHSSSTSSP